MEEVANKTETESRIKGYKKICFKIGLVISVFFISSMVCSLITHGVNTDSVTLQYILTLSFSVIFLYIVPIAVSLVILKGEDGFPLSPKRLYKKPARLTKALGNFPAVFGLGQMTSLLCLGVMWIISKLVQNANEIADPETIERSFGTMNSLTPPNILCGVILFIHMTLAAAFFEELLCRGILLNALKPYGNGFAIIITGFIFGMIHGNFRQFFFAFVLGIVFAYITIQTGSIFTSTILHAMFNSLSAVLLLFMSTEAVQTGLYPNAWNVLGDKEKLIFASFVIYLALFLMLLITGISLAVKKLARLKTYKAENNFTEITAKKKTLLFFTSVPVMFMLLLAVDRFAGGFVVQLIIGNNM